ncbi:hypothetical protein ODJ79_20730 [Actinoplanes sp. KI2]|uniref:hypothetical protein n=1 Tax=Actinoplanes sp. KI2 TaxID=2983315 RepID=UPI0021D60CF8|nr:hypothetical protein [Actinoplanes sp. KI2]MCU7726159.1 hypothetical protein [Actinoplanes sp. KI2]
MARLDGERRQVEKIWSVTATEDDCVELVLEKGAPRPLVAAITEAELRSLIEPLRPVDEAVRRNEFSRPQLASICRDVIGRDPFDEERVAPDRSPVWADLGLLAGGVIAATGHLPGWWRDAGGAVAAYGLYLLSRRGWRRLRSRQP